VADRGGNLSEKSGLKKELQKTKEHSHKRPYSGEKGVFMLSVRTGGWGKGMKKNETEEGEIGVTKDSKKSSEGAFPSEGEERKGAGSPRKRGSRRSGLSTLHRRRNSAVRNTAGFWGISSKGRTKEFRKVKANKGKSKERGLGAKIKGNANQQQRISGG